MIPNRTYARTLEEIATLMTLAGAGTFKVRAFERAARAIDRGGEPIHDKVVAGDATDLANVGKSIAAELEALARGDVPPALSTLRAEVPTGLVELLDVPGLGSKRIRELHDRLGVSGPASLRQALLDGALGTLPGFGKKSETRLLTALDRFERMAGLLAYPRAIRLAQELIDAIELAADGTVRTAIAGGLARAEDFVEELVLVTTAAPAQVSEAIDGEHVGDIVRATRAVPVRVVLRQANTLAWSTWLESSDETHRAGIEALSDQRESDDERALADALGIPWVPPPQRVAGTLEAITEGWWAPPVDVGDLVSDLHMHTTWSDGVVSVREMAEAARDRGLTHIAITDHSGSLRVANGLDRERLLAQIDEIDALNASGQLGIRVLKGLEVDILSDGTLDMDADVLRRLDWVVGSVHQAMRMNADTMTARLIAAVESGHLSAIGHPTGRKIGKREAYAFDLDAVLDVCEEHGVALEINASPNRMDLRDEHVRAVLERPGLWLTINTDAHSIRELANARHGVLMAQRAGVPADRVLNCLPLADFVAETRRA